MQVDVYCMCVCVCVCVCVYVFAPACADLKAINHSFLSPCLSATTCCLKHLSAHVGNPWCEERNCNSGQCVASHAARSFLSSGKEERIGVCLLASLSRVPRAPPPAVPQPCLRPHLVVCWCPSVSQEEKSCWSVTLSLRLATLDGKFSDL